MNDQQTILQFTMQIIQIETIQMSTTKPIFNGCFLNSKYFHVKADKSTQNILCDNFNGVLRHSISIRKRNLWSLN